MAALEQFMRTTTTVAGAPPMTADPWRQAALLKGVARGEHHDLPDPWINT